MSEEDVKQFLDFSCAYGRCVCQLSNYQSYTKAKAGTLPHSCCSNNLFWESVQLDIGNGQLNSIEEKESEEEMCNEETEHSDDDSRSSDN